MSATSYNVFSVRSLCSGIPQLNWDLSFKQITVQREISFNLKGGHEPSSKGTSSQHHANSDSSQKAHCVQGPSGSPHTHESNSCQKGIRNISGSAALVDKYRKHLYGIKALPMVMGGVFVLSFPEILEVSVWEGRSCLCVQCGVGALRVTKSNLLWSNQSQCLP